MTSHTPDHARYSRSIQGALIKTEFYSSALRDRREASGCARRGTSCPSVRGGNGPTSTGACVLRHLRTTTRSDGGSYWKWRQLCYVGHLSEELMLKNNLDCCWCGRGFTRSCRWFVKRSVRRRCGEPRTSGASGIAMMNRQIRAHEARLKTVRRPNRESLTQTAGTDFAMAICSRSAGAKLVCVVSHGGAA